MVTFLLREVFPCCVNWKELQNLSEPISELIRVALFGGSNPHECLLGAN
jgi:hypothetical protein